VESYHSYTRSLVTRDTGKAKIETAKARLRELLTSNGTLKEEANIIAVRIKNREEARKAAEGLYDNVANSKFTRTIDFDNEAAEAKLRYNAASVGDGWMKTEGWALIERNIPSLCASVAHASAAEETRNLSAQQLEEKIINGIKGDYANLLCVLGYSWINGSSNFATSVKGRSDNRRDYILYNTNKYEGFQSENPTHMSFSDFHVLMDEIILDPSFTVELPLEQLPPESFGPFGQTTFVTCDTTHSQSRSYTQSPTIGLKVGPEFTDSVTSITAPSPTFAANPMIPDRSACLRGNTKNTEGSTITMPASYPMFVPAGKSAKVTRIALKNKQTVTYTARIKLIPKLSTLDGFLRWGGGKYTDGHKEANYHKEHTGNRATVASDLGPANEVINKFNSNAWPWDWQECNRRYDGALKYWAESLSLGSRYQFFVRGKIEGFVTYDVAIQPKLTDVKPYLKL